MTVDHPRPSAPAATPSVAPLPAPVLPPQRTGPPGPGVELPPFLRPHAPRPPHAAEPLTRDELAALPSAEPLVDGVLDTGTVVLLAGASGGAKSFLALGWSAAVATGAPWVGREVRAPGRVLYVAGEGTGGLHGRLTAWEQHARTGVASDRLAVVPAAVDLRDRAAVTRLCALAEDRALVVLDTLARCLPGADENMAGDMGLAVDAAHRLRAASGGTVVLVHHVGKDGTTVRGSSALEAGVDDAWRLTRRGDRVEGERIKRREGPTGPRLRLRLVPVGPSCVLVPGDQAGEGGA